MEQDSKNDFETVNCAVASARWQCSPTSHREQYNIHVINGHSTEYVSKQQKQVNVLIRIEKIIIILEEISCPVSYETYRSNNSTTKQRYKNYGSNFVSTKS